MMTHTSKPWKLLGAATGLALSAAGLTGIATAAHASPAPAVPVTRALSGDSGPAVHHDTSPALAWMAAHAGPPAAATAAPFLLHPPRNPGPAPIDPVVQRQPG